MYHCSFNQVSGRAIGVQGTECNLLWVSVCTTLVVDDDVVLLLLISSSSSSCYCCCRTSNFLVSYLDANKN